MTAFARIHLATRTAFARLEGDQLFVLRGAPWDSNGDGSGEGDANARGASETGETVPFASARLAAPVTPTKVIGVGRNYRAHAAELGNEIPPEPLLFLKPPSAIVGPDEPIFLPPQSERVDHEAELGVVIGRCCRAVTEERALDYVFGFTCVNDVSARDLQKKDGQWARAKGFDSFCPVGPLLVTGLDPRSLGVRCRVGGDIRQDGNTSDMIFPVARIISYISDIMTLEPGDLIATGTPHGVGPLAPGDTVEVEVDGIGVLRSPVRLGEPRRKEG